MSARTFVKQRWDAPPGFFEVEAAGLRWLAVPGGVPVVEPLEVSARHLATPRLDEVAPSPEAAEEFGRRLAVTHAAGARWFGPAEAPARIHGDLWSGNVIWSADGVSLIDPAAHGGHRETDLAMLALFGTPYLDRVLAAYDEAAPLADGWRDRIGLHQLHPLLVHVVLFGSGYVGQALAAVRRY